MDFKKFVAMLIMSDTIQTHTIDIVDIKTNEYAK
jgi:hypothetical protein